tara:strand:+ start:1874 stop:2299 length:426 start_codon:yes stop_codon:yes gene_type:complete
MTKKLPPKAARKSKKTKFVANEQMNRRMQSAMSSIAAYADKDARKDDKTQREARAAFAATLDVWIDCMMDQNPEAIEDLFFEFGCFATATNRKRMLKHSIAPEGIDERIEAQLVIWKADAEAERAAAKAATETSGKDRTGE